MRTLKRRRWWVALVAVVVVAGGVSAFWLTRGGGSATAATSYRLVAASTGTIRQTVSATGTIEPAVQDSLNFQVSGQVTAVKVAQGQQVAKGAVLATVDSASLQANLAQAQASLASSQARLTSDTDASASSTQLAADSAAVTAAQGQVTSAQAALADATLTSPIAGVVASVNLTVGQQVSGTSGSGTSGGSGGSGGSGSGSGGGSGGAASQSSSSASSSAQVLVISTNSWLVNASVDSTGVGLLATGDQAQVVPGSGGGTVYGTIASIGLIASSSSGVATYPVVVNITGSPTGLHAGDTATVSLIYRQLTDVLTVPTAAVHVVNGKSVVYQMVNGKRTAKPVSVGMASGGLTQITSGIAEGDQVVLDVAARTPGTATRTGSNNQRRFPGGGFGGGGFGGGGFSGGGGGGGGFVTRGGGN